jgi:sugar phosphate permease
MHETYAYAILNRKTRRLRKETGNQHLRSVLHQGRSPRNTIMTAIIRPTKMLACSPTIFLISLIMFLFYGYFYLLFTAMPVLLEGVYGFSTGSIGLTYIGPGIGSLIGSLISGAISDTLAKHMNKAGGEGKPEYRMPLLVAASFIVPIGLFWTGWTAEFRQHWILPIIGTSILSIGVILAFVSQKSR